MSAYAQRALTVTFPPVPLFTRVCPFGFFVSSGGLSFDRAPFYSRPTRAYHSKIYRRAALTHTAWCLPTCLVRRSSIARLPRLCRSRRCPYSADTLKFLTRQAPVGRGKWYHRTCLCPPGGHNQSSSQASPVIGGPGGVVTMNTRLRRGVRRSHTPWRIFGYFLCEQKVTSVSPNKKPQPVCSDCGFAFKKNNYSPLTTKLGRCPS